MRSERCGDHDVLALLALVQAGCDPSAAEADRADVHVEEHDDPAIEPWLRAPGPDGATAPQLRVLLTDAPGDFEAVFVTFDGIAVHTCAAADEPADAEPAADEPADAEPAEDEPAEDEPAEDEPAEDEPAEDEPADDEPADDGDDCEGSWTAIDVGMPTIDLLTLQGGVSVELGVASLPSGSYGSLRLHVVEASVVIDGEELPVVVPPGHIQLNGGFELADGMATEILVDFDAGHSLHHSNGHGWMLNPVVSLVSTTSAPIEPE